MRTQRWRLVKNEELYDISVDPFESKNLMADYPDVVARLRDAYDDWWRETVPLMVNEGVPYAPQQPQAVRYEKQLSERGIPAWKVTVF